MKKTAIAIVAAATVGAFGLAGCSASTPGSASSSSSGAAPVTLTVAGYIGGEQEPGGIPDLIKKFETENPNVTIQFQFESSSDYDTYLNPRLAAGTAPDVLMTDKTHMNTWVPMGYLADLSDQPWVSRYDDNLEAYTSVGGKTYQFLAQNIPLGLYVNLDLLKSVGINSVPTDWPSFTAALKTLKDNGKNGLLLPGGSDGWNLEMNALSLGANLVPADWAKTYDTGGSKWNPTWAPVVDQLKQVFQNGDVDGTKMAGIDPFSQGVQMFSGGDWAFYVDGAWDLSHFKTTAKFNFSLNPYPGGAAGTQPQAVTYLGAGWGVNAKAKNPEVARKFVAFLAEPDNYQVFLQAEACFSTLKDVQNEQIAAEAKPFADTFAAGRTRPDDIHTLNFNNGGTAMEKVLEKIYNDPNVATTDLLSQLDQQVPATPVSAK